MSKTIAVIPGDGIGPEIMAATLHVLDALDCGLTYDTVEAGMIALEKHGDLLPKPTIDAIAKHKVALKGPLTTPVGGGFTSINVTLRRHFDLYANVRPAISFPGTKARYDNIDIITVRENTEGAYLSEGQTLSEDGELATSMIRVTRKGCARIVRYAFEMAVKKGRKKVTAVHKANIIKTASGLFLNVAREIAKDFPQIEFNEMIVDNACMQLVMNPYQYDVLVMENLYGDIISDLCAAFVGGLGLVPSANLGDGCAIFEAVHGSAPDIAGKNMANPTAVLRSSLLMLRHLGEHEAETKIRRALENVYRTREKLTRDVGGQAGTSQFADSVIEEMQSATAAVQS